MVQWRKLLKRRLNNNVERQCQSEHHCTLGWVSLWTDHARTQTIYIYIYKLRVLWVKGCFNTQLIVSRSCHWENWQAERVCDFLSPSIPSRSELGFGQVSIQGIHMTSRPNQHPLSPSLPACRTRPSDAGIVTDQFNDGCDWLIFGLAGRPVWPPVWKRPHWAEVRWPVSKGPVRQAMPSTWDDWHGNSRESVFVCSVWTWMKWIKRKKERNWFISPTIQADVRTAILASALN